MSSLRVAGALSLTCVVAALLGWSVADTRAAAQRATGGEFHDAMTVGQDLHAFAASLECEIQSAQRQSHGWTTTWPPCGHRDDSP